MIKEPEGKGTGASDKGASVGHEGKGAGRGRREKVQAKILS